jgi:hypothetical protein
MKQKSKSRENVHVHDYLSRAEETAAGILHTLRTIILDFDPRIEEEFKWGNPCYSYLGIMVYLRAFKNHATLGFFNGNEIPDPEGRLEGAENPKMRSIRYRNVEDIDEDIVREYLSRAMRAKELLQKR